MKLPILTAKALVIHIPSILALSSLIIGCETPGPKSPVFEASVSCIGSPRAKNKAVYLHGMHGQRLSRLEQKNTKNLKKLAKMLNLQIAFPKSAKGCEFQNSLQRCWGADMTRSQALETLKTAEKAAQSCFGSSRSYGIIGFGNGGYMATKIFSYCLAPEQSPQLKWIVTAGSAKLWGSGYSRRNLKDCRPITLVAGKADRHNYQRNQRYFQNLRNKGADISIIVFQGGHELPFGPMVTAIRKYTQ